MPLVTGTRVVDFAAGLVLKPAVVGAISEHDGFRTIELTGERLIGMGWAPGDKLRLRTDGLTLRTYTPIVFDRDRGTTSFVAYLHGTGPGAQWCRDAQSGDACQVRFDHSLRLDRLASAPVFVGDESSFGLLLALLSQGPDVAPVVARFEVTDPGASRATLRDLGVDAVDLVGREPNDAHLDAFGQGVVDALRAYPDAPLCITGRAQTISAVRKQIKAADESRRDSLVKAYWDVNRKGLD